MDDLAASDDQTQDTGQPAEPVKTETAAPAPAYVTMEQFTQFATNLQEQFAAGMAQVGAQIAGAIPRQAEHQDDPEPTDDEIDAAALEGRGVGRSVKRAVAAAMKRVQRETAQQVGEVRGVGLPALAAQSLAIAKQGWDHYDDPRFKKEIDTAIAAIPLELQAMPENLNRVYHMVMGSHQKTLLKEAREAAIREARETPENGRMPANSSRTPKGEAIDAETVFSNDDRQNLRLAGKDIETIARKLGKTPEQYLAGVKRYQNRERAA